MDLLKIAEELGFGPPSREPLVDMTVLTRDLVSAGELADLIRNHLEASQNYGYWQPSSREGIQEAAEWARGWALAADNLYGWEYVGVGIQVLEGSRFEVILLVKVDPFLEPLVEMETSYSQSPDYNTYQDPGSDSGGSGGGGSSGRGGKVRNAEDPEDGPPEKPRSDRYDPADTCEDYADTLLCPDGVPDEEDIWGGCIPGQGGYIMVSRAGTYEAWATTHRLSSTTALATSRMQPMQQRVWSTSLTTRSQ